MKDHLRRGGGRGGESHPGSQRGRGMPGSLALGCFGPNPGGRERRDHGGRARAPAPCLLNVRNMRPTHAREKSLFRRDAEAISPPLVRQPRAECSRPQIIGRRTDVAEGLTRGGRTRVSRDRRLCGRDGEAEVNNNSAAQPALEPRVAVASIRAPPSTPPEITATLVSC